MTIYDIAKIAGVSASSVSRVINNKPGINEEKRKQIQALLKEYHYTPNEGARGLVNQSTKIVGVLMEDIRLSHHTESTYVVQQELMKAGYICIALSTGYEERRKAEYIRLMEQRRVDGVILVGSMFCVPEVEEAIRVHLPSTPVVMVNGYLPLPNVYGILIDEEGGVADSVGLLARKGKKDLTFAINLPSPANEKKKNGFLRGAQQWHIPPERANICYGPPGDCDSELTIQRGEELTRSVLADRPGTDAIIYSDDLLAIGGLRALEAMGRAVPEEVAVVGIDNTLLGKMCRPSLTTLDNKLVEVNQNAADTLLKVLEEKSVPHKMMLFPDIIEREST